MANDQFQHVHRVRVDQAKHIEVYESGVGESLVLIQTALDAQELLLLARVSGIAEHFRVIDVRRRGYGGSTRTPGPGSVRRDAEDCLV